MSTRHKDLATTLREWAHANPEPQITVTAEDIAHGVQQECERCPIALAIARITPPEMRVVVQVQDALIFASATYERARFAMYRLPREAWTFIRAFDAMGPSRARPFEFTMRIDSMYRL